MALSIKSAKAPTIRESTGLLGQILGSERSDSPTGLVKAKSTIGTDTDEKKREGDDGEVATEGSGSNAQRFSTPGRENFLSRMQEAQSKAAPIGAGSPGGGGSGGGAGSIGGGGSASGSGGSGGGFKPDPGGGGQPRPPQAPPETDPGGGNNQIEPWNSQGANKQTDLKLSQLKDAKIYNSDDSINVEKTQLNNTAKSAAEKQGSAVLVFTGRKCPPCQELSKQIEKLQKEGHAIVKIDADEQKDIAKKFGVTKWPTSVAGYFDKDGKFVERERKQGPDAKLADMETRADKAKKDYDKGLIKPDPKKPDEAKKPEQNPANAPLGSDKKAAFAKATDPKFADDPKDGLTRTQALRYLAERAKDSKTDLTTAEKKFIADFTTRKLSMCAGGACGTDFSSMSDKKFEQELKGFNNPDTMNKKDGKSLGYVLSSYGSGNDKELLTSSHSAGTSGETREQYPDINQGFDGNLASLTQRLMKQEEQKSKDTELAKTP